MCRNIKTLFNFDPPVTDDEVRAASLQFVRKITGFNKPSKSNEASFLAAVDEVALARNDGPAEESRGRSYQGKSPRRGTLRNVIEFANRARFSRLLDFSLLKETPYAHSAFGTDSPLNLSSNLDRPHRVSTQDFAWSTVCRVSNAPANSGILQNSHWSTRLLLAMHTRRLDDRIRNLCAQITEATDGELEAILQDLLGAIHEKIERLRSLAASQFLGRKPAKERRTIPPA